MWIALDLKYEKIANNYSLKLHKNRTNHFIITKIPPPPPPPDYRQSMNRWKVAAKDFKIN